MTRRLEIASRLAALLIASQAVAVGSIEGVVRFGGALPKAELLKRQIDPVCAKTEARDESILVSSEGHALGNVVLRLKGLASELPVPAEPVVIDQRECLYHPRVVIARLGQSLKMTNSDSTLHNIHSYLGNTRTLFNQAQPPKAAPLFKTAAGDDIISLKCDIHPWMRGYIALATNPYFALTQKDGKFRIDGVPDGEYTLEAWHETLGRQNARVKIQASRSTRLTFTFGNQK